jgi:hypothetical protein
MINQHYELLAKSLGISELALSLANGEIELPDPEIATPAGNYGFPPGLLPLWSEGSGPFYVGYWWHWFTSRQPTLVRIDVEAGYLVDEIARTLEQLVRLVALGSICFKQGISPSLRAFAARVGIDDLDAIDRISLVTGDDPTGLIAHPLFAADPPLACVPTGVGYRGDFPHRTPEGTLVGLDAAAGLEIPVTVLEEVAIVEDAPAWLRVRGQKALFNEYIQRNKLGEAWLSANSPNWRFIDMKSALKELANSAQSETFSLLASAWTSLPHETFGGY